jgi:hypothetical protein
MKPLPPRLVETACIVLALGILHPLIGTGFLWGHDTGAHLFRLVEVAQGLSDGVLYPRFIPDAYGGLGGPIMNFNPVAPYYLPAFLVVAGAGPTAALKIASGLFMLGGGLSLRLMARPLLGRSGAAVAGLAFVYLPYRIANLYVRMAFSELAAMLILPLAMATARKAALSPTPGRIAVAALSLAALPIVHFPASVLGIPAVLLYAVIYIRRGAVRRSLGGLAAMVALALILSAFSWLPAMVEIRGTHYQDSTSGYDNYKNHFVTATQIFSPRWGFGSSMPGSQDQMSFQMGLVHLGALSALLATALFWIPRARSLALFCGVVCGLGGFLMLESSRWIWNLIPVLQNVQFPWRILMLTGIATSLAVGYAAVLPAVAAPGRSGRHSKRMSRTIAPMQGEKTHRLVLAAVAALAVGASLPYLQSRPGDGSDTDFTPEVIRQRYFGELKFQPREVEILKYRPPGPRAQLIRGGEARIVQEKTHYKRIEVNALVPSTLRVHLFNSPGWQASSDSKPLKIKTEQGTGMVLVDVPAGKSHVELIYGNTPVRTAGWSLSLAGVLVAGAGLVFTRLGSSRLKRSSGALPIDSGEASP